MTRIKLLGGVLLLAMMALAALVGWIAVQPSKPLEYRNLPPRPPHLAEAQAAYDAGDYATTLAILRPLADQGDPAAQAFFGLMYDYGRGVIKNEVVAVDWYRKAAEQGDPRGVFNLAVSYEWGIGGEIDEAKATQFYIKAAELGSIDALLTLGDRFRLGSAHPPDFQKVVTWYRLGAEAGNAEAMVRLALMLENDPDAFRHWLNRAGQAGHKKGWFILWVFGFPEGAQHLTVSDAACVVVHEYILERSFYRC